MNLRRLFNRWRNPLNETRVHLQKLVTRYGFEIGEFSYGHPKVRFPESGAKLKIGRFCSIADRVEILLGGDHRTDWATTFPFSAFRERWQTASPLNDYHRSGGDVTIGHDVWIGSQVMIMSGVTIGNGAVIGARAVVVKDVAPYEVVGGVPAKVIRSRFDPETIKALIETAWWDLPDEEISRIVPLLQSNDIHALLREITTMRTDRTLRD